MQNHFGLLDTDMMPMFMIIALDIVITLRFSINCSTVICSPTVIFSISREVTSETYAPGSLFHIIKSRLHLASFRSTILQPLLSNLQTKNTKNIYFTVYLSLLDLTLQVTVNGLITPLSRWVQVVDCLCRYSVTCALSPTGLIPWFSKLREILTLLCCITLSSSRENQRKLKR